MLLDEDQRSALSSAELDLVAKAKRTRVSQRTLTYVRDQVADGGDPLGDTYCDLVPGAQRRGEGQFYTPREVVDQMTAWALTTSPVRIVDAGSGSGRFGVAARRQGFTGVLVAVDTDPLACLMTRAHLAAAQLAPATVMCESFLELQLPAVAGKTCWLGNPPYVRHHALSRDVKAWAKRTGTELGVSVSGLAGLHALFYLAVAQHSAPGDTGCFITSSEWTDSAYGESVRKLLTGPLGLRSLNFLSPQAQAFEDADTTALVTCWDTSAKSTHAQVATARCTDELLDPSRGSSLSLKTLAKEVKWSELGSRQRRKKAGMVPLGELVSVRRGLATGANSFFTLPERKAGELGLAAYSTPVVCRAQEVIKAGGVLTRASGKVLLLLPERTTDERVADYVACGEAAGVHEGYLASSRAEWYRIKRPAIPDAVATYMARGNPSFALNQVQACTLNTVHGLFAHSATDPRDLGALVRWLNAQAASVGAGKTYSGGLVKFEPRDMERILVPEPGSAPLSSFYTDA